jgi:hypothetical protein
MNVRSGPGVVYSRVGGLPQGGQAAIVGRAAHVRWWKIVCPADAGGDECWISGGSQYTRAEHADGVPLAVAPPTPTPRPTPTPTDTPVPDGTLKDNDVPPEGVAAQLGFFPAHIPCADPLKPGDGKQIGTVETASRSRICFAKFKPDNEISVSVMQPGGAVLRQGTVTTEGSGAGVWTWVILPGDPLGTYTLTATQGQLKAVATFTVVRAMSPRIIVHPRSGVPGTTFSIGLAGFQPSLTAPLYLYRQRDRSIPSFNYATQLSSVRTDARGEAIYTLRTQWDDPVGEYLAFVDKSADPLLIAGRFSVVHHTSLKQPPVVAPKEQLQQATPDKGGANE